MHTHTPPSPPVGSHLHLQPPQQLASCSPHYLHPPHAYMHTYTHTYKHTNTNTHTYIHIHNLLLLYAPLFSPPSNLRVAFTITFPLVALVLTGAYLKRIAVIIWPFIILRSVEICFNHINLRVCLYECMYACMQRSDHLALRHLEICRDLL
jgi:hypothetical protein